MPDSGKSRQLPSKHSAVPLQELERVRSLCWAGLVRGRFKYLRVSVRDGRVRVSVSNRVSKAVVAEFIESHLEQVARWLAEQEEKKLLRRQNDPLCADYRHEGHIGYQGQVLGIRCMEHLQRTRLSDDARELWVKSQSGSKAGGGLSRSLSLASIAFCGTFAAAGGLLVGAYRTASERYQIEQCKRSMGKLFPVGSCAHCLAYDLSASRGSRLRVGA